MAIQSKENKLDLLGYADKLSVEPDDRIRFMVSSDMPNYEATIVRLVHSDQGPNGPGVSEEVVDTLVTGQYNGRQQPIHQGSYIFVPDCQPLRSLRNLTLQAWVYPTTPHRGEVQGMLTKWSYTDGAGYGLFIEPEGDVALWIGDETGLVEKLRSGIPLHAKQWYFIACTYDADERRARLYQKPLIDLPLDKSRVTVERTTQGRVPGERPVPFLIAGAHAATSLSGKWAVLNTYNGKIDHPRIFNCALDDDEIAALGCESPSSGVRGEALVAEWDFALHIGSATVIDVGPHGLHGETVNMPTRAVTGHNWTGQQVNFNDAPEQYGAIHFHADDLEDAGWEEDFSLSVPKLLRSGVYAARLTSNDKAEYIPFFVRPKRGTSSIPIAFLAPTMTYAAYANRRLSVKYDAGDVTGMSIAIEIQDTNQAVHPELGLSLYDVHQDGSGCSYSSRLRPSLNVTRWNLAGDHYLVDWLEQKHYQYDVLTDEDLHREGLALLTSYRVVLTGTHPEYWTALMMAAMKEYLDVGGRLMYLGGNGFYWVMSVDLLRPHIFEVRRGMGGTRTWESAPGETYHSTTGELGGLWRYRGEAPQKLAGVGFTAQGWGGASGYRRQAGSFDERAAFIFEGIGEDEIIGNFGLAMNGAAGDELDRMDYSLGTPPHTLLLASSTGHTDAYQLAVEDILMTLPGQGGTQNPKVRSDMVFFETPNGGEVFSVGSINWCASLSHNTYDNNVSRITENVLRRFSS